MLPIEVNSLVPLRTAQHLACSIQEHLASANTTCLGAFDPNR